MGTTQGVYGMIDANGAGGAINVPAGAAAYLYPDVFPAPIVWETARLVIQLDAGYGGGAPGTISFSAQLSHDGTNWHDVTIRNLTEVYDGVTANNMAADTIQVAAVVATGVVSDVAIGFREPGPFVRVRADNEGATDVAITAHLYTTG